MSTHKNINKICVLILGLVLIITVLFINGDQLGIQSTDTRTGYDTRLFDTSTVHTIDIEMDDWDEFLETCENEEYSVCSVVIDNEAYKNVGIRAKGNTSLTQVASYGNDRYSFKIEFDQYDNAKNYYGLDKLSLNNIIQDNTYMKDYLTYQMMQANGVNTPLCSYVYITVNGEDWGLYLAVESVEEGFLERNYGSSYGQVYKPDSMSMGGGRGNGNEFNIEDFADDTKSADNVEEEINPESSENGTAENGDTMPERGEMPEGMDRGSGGMSMGSDDVSLIYTDDEYDSYSNIFDNAKTNISDSDKTRLIASLKSLNENQNIEDVVNVEEVIRYFVVHNFVCNFDSYTGSMIHNYYLYEEDGQMSMIPWDYNLAFGGFESQSDATGLVNYPIDTPVSGGTTDSRPMLAWIFSNEEYTELYHQIFSELMASYFDSGEFEEMIDSVSATISPYVEQDPTKFCTFEEFEQGVSVLKEFCLLRAESVEGQLDESIPSTSDGQSEASETLVDASAITISDMGSMNNSMGQGKNMSSDITEEDSMPDKQDFNPDTASDSKEFGQDTASGNQGAPPDMSSDTQGSGSEGAQNEQGFPGENMAPDSAEAGGESQTSINLSSWILLGVSGIMLIAGLLFAFKIKKKN
jgi:spore coat protein CotH